MSCCMQFLFYRYYSSTHPSAHASTSYRNSYASTSYPIAYASTSSCSHRKPNFDRNTIYCSE